METKEITIEEILLQVKALKEKALAIVGDKKSINPSKNVNL